MGWIYGNTIIDTNNSVEIPSYQYDKVFSNYYLAKNTETQDNIFLGRKVLVDYNQPLIDTLDKVVKWINDEGIEKYYYWKPEAANYSILELVSQATLPKDTYVCQVDNNGTFIRYLQCSTELNEIGFENEVIFYDDLINEQTGEFQINKIQQYYNENLNLNNEFTLSIYEFNLLIDKEFGKSYDSTVWQKVYIENDIKYIMIAELNAKNPTFDLLIKPPKSNGLPSIPQINIESEDKYKLILSTQPGLRIRSDGYQPVEPYRPKVYYYFDDNDEPVYEDAADYQRDRQYYRQGIGTVTIIGLYEPGEFYIESEGQKQLDNRTLDDIQKDSIETLRSTQYYKEMSDDISIHSYYRPTYEKIEEQITGDTFQDIENKYGNIYYLMEEEYLKTNGLQENYNGDYYYIKAYNTQIDQRASSSGIYYNKEGFDKETRTISNIVNSIRVDFDGSSGYYYDKNDYYELANDIYDNNSFNNNKQFLYYMINDESGYQLVSSTDIYDETKKYYRKVTTNEGFQIDTNQLSICLPAIGNMVCEGWDLIYGTGDEEGSRNLNRYEYDYTSNTLIGNENEINKEEDNLTGLYNLYAKEVQRLKSYDESFSSTTTDNISSSIPLVTTTDTQEGVEFITTHPLKGNNIIQNQIAINNSGIKSIADKIGLTYNNNKIFEQVENITKDSYQPNLYYYSDNNEYKLATDEFDSSKDYFMCRIQEVELDTERKKLIKIDNLTEEEFNNYKNETTKNLYYYIDTALIQITNDSNFDSNKDYYTYTNLTIQEQVTTDYTNLNHRWTDISKIASMIGFTYSNATFSTAASISYSSAISSTIQEQILGNDNDISNLASLIGISRNNQGAFPTAITISGNDTGLTLSGHFSTLYQSVNYKDNDIKKLANRIRRIEEFLEDGHFLFTDGRSISSYYYDNLQPIPGENRYISAVTYVSGISYYSQSQQSGSIFYTPITISSAEDLIKNNYYINWVYSESSPVRY